MIFNTFEGGAIISHDARTYQRLNYLKNFGFAGETTVVAPGINAKMNEFQAGMGLLQLQYMEEVLCLPIYPDLEFSHVDNIIEILRQYKS